MPAHTKHRVSMVTRCLSLVVSAVLISACSDGPTEVPGGLDLPELVEFRGSYVDVSTCVRPGDGSWPITIWLYDYDAQTDSVKVGVGRGSGATSHTHTSATQFRGTLTPRRGARTGELQAFRLGSGGRIDEEVEIRATVTPTTIDGDIYEYCSDGTADIWRFSATRHNE